MSTVRIPLQPRRVSLLALLLGCSGADPCVDEQGQGALSTCLEPTLSEDYYIEQSDAYFDTMDYNEDRDLVPPYSELVARWEWPPWLKLTAFGRDDMIAADTLLRLYP
ncbi:MAG: hypothetical protein QGG40_17745, partial [Myxococcota bacterium]|nr:hypothetical protein [Myxococcota bacterium]